MWQPLFITQNVIILTDNLTNPSWSLRIIKEMLDLESGELSFDFGSATNSLNEHSRAVLLLCIRRVSVQTTSRRTLVLVIDSYVRHARMSVKCVVREAAKVFSGGSNKTKKHYLG